MIFFFHSDKNRILSLQVWAIKLVSVDAELNGESTGTRLITLSQPDRALSIFKVEKPENLHVGVIGNIDFPGHRYPGAQLFILRKLRGHI